MIKAIVFDMGGVIVNLDPQICISNFKTLAGFDEIEDYLDKYHQKGFISDFEEGKLDIDGFYAECKKRSRPGTTDETIKACLDSLLRFIYPETKALIKKLYGKYDLFILSNNNPLSRGRFLELLNADDPSVIGCFKKQFFSFEMRMLKPGRGIFDEAVKEMGVQADEALFIDDSIANVKGAEAAGLKALWLKEATSIEEDVMNILNNDK